MKILAIGDIIGSPGRTYLKENLSRIKEQYQIDFIIANGENTAGGVGIDLRCATELFDAGANVITLGNHTWRKKDVVKILDDPRVVRPINYLEGTKGEGCRIINFNSKKIAVLNAVGRTDMNPAENPFVAVSKKVDEIKEKVDIIILDFHAEATSEKIAMGHYLDGRVNCVYGTHTHVQTADEKILEKGTAYITDIGMTGPKDSVIGADKHVVMSIFVTEIPDHMPVAGGEAQFNGIVITIDDKTNKTTAIERVNL